MTSATPKTVAAARFFGWVFVLSIPFYVWGIFWPVHGLAFGLPATVTMVIVPAAVATISTSWESGTTAAWALWRRIGDVRRVPRAFWFAAVLLCMPIASVLAYVSMRILAMPLPRMAPVSALQVLLIFGTYALGAVFEEVGWTGYATDPLQRRYGVFGAGIILGVIWALWHVVPWWLGQGHELRWVVGQSLSAVAMRVLMGWIYARGGRSLFLAILFHAMINTSYSLFPNGGSAYDPVVMASILSAIATAIAFVTRAEKVRSIPRARF